MRIMLSRIVLALLGLIQRMEHSTKTRARQLHNWAQREVNASAGAREAKASAGVREINTSAGACERVCHYKQLFVNHNGDVFPCCLVWGRKNMRIGHVSDPDLLSRLKQFSSPCSCERYVLRKARSSDQLALETLNLELSLACQAKCAMCCVGAPSWKGTFDLYPALTQLVINTRPKDVLVQGGEILVQPRSLAWIEQMKSDYGTNFSIVTNASIPLEMVDQVERLFSKVSVSFVGFQPLTYRRIMGLDLDRTIAFVQALNRRGTTEIFLKYLVTPLNSHELDLFLEWAIALKPHRGYVFVESASTNYMNFSTSDRYWNVLFERTGEAVRQVLLDYRDMIVQHDVSIRISGQVFDLYAPPKSDWTTFLANCGLEKHVTPYLC